MKNLKKWTKATCTYMAARIEKEGGKRKKKSQLQNGKVGASGTALASFNGREKVQPFNESTLIKMVGST